ncbi:DUF1275 domain-containing protein [Legionella hackeliae]|nr:DUF1275 domain-containing protein [Legionella hackeliae]KTD09667.1 hypothetical protein Lhac_2035 [Legionella hackeliae]STX47758.1 Uncharacterised protein [Legionella hackeliae]
MRDGEFYAGGLELRFFHNDEFEDVRTPACSDKAAATARNALRILMMGWHENWPEIISPQIIQAVFVRRDRELMRGMRLAFQEGFETIYKQLQAQDQLSPAQLTQAEFYISSCLTLLPYSDINPYESITIPQRINNEWRLVNYKVVPIELTPTNGFHKLFIQDEDRVFAYGLEPIADKEAQSHLIFMGTTYPAGQGFNEQVNSDLKGFDTVGNNLYLSGRSRILAWLATQTQKVKVCGTSLGGSLSLLFSIDQGDKLSQVHALNPAGLYDSWFKDHIDNWETLTTKPEVTVLRGGKDPVSRFGAWKSEWNIFHVIPPANKQGPNKFVDHALNYTGFAETQFIKIDTASDNEENKRRNFWLYTLGRGFIYYTGVVPYLYVIRPGLRFVANHKMQMVLTCALFLLFTLLPIFLPSIVLPALGLAAMLINAFVSSVVIGFLADKTLWFFVDLYKNESDSKFSKFLGWLRQQSAFTLTALGLGAASAGLSLSLFLVGPLLFPSILFVLASITLVIYLPYKINEMLSVVFSNGKIPPPACHEPSVTRNPSLDIYTNKQEEIFSLKELGDYYKAKRELVKNKPFIPLEDKLDKKNRFGGRSKKELLSQSLLEDSNKTFVTVNDTAAKIYDMRQTVRLMNRIGFYPEETFKEILKENHDNYQRGKPENLLKY